MNETATEKFFLGRKGFRMRPKSGDLPKNITKMLSSEGRIIANSRMLI